MTCRPLTTPLTVVPEPLLILPPAKRPVGPTVSVGAITWTSIGTAGVGELAHVIGA